MNNLATYRMRADLTLTELSQKTGIPESVINRAEKGATDPCGERWKLLARALDCTLDELLGNEV